MKGLLLKDFYTAIKYCRIFILIILGYLIFSCFVSESALFMVYPMIFAGIIPTTLFSYDEREKWNITCETLPCTRAQYVSGKFLMGLCFEIVALILSAIAQAVKMSLSGTFNIPEYFSLLGIMLGFGIIVPAVILPLLFRFGAEKGRIAYFIVISLLCVGTTALMGSDIIKPDMTSSLLIAPIICATAVMLFALSWCLSVLLYNKREL